MVVNEAKAEFYKKFDEKAKTEKKVFSFGTNKTVSTETSEVSEEIVEI